MSRLLAALAAALTLTAAPAAAQALRAPAPPPQNHAADDVECSACHTGKHRGVQRMYEGVGGRGIPPIPARMFQTRVQCVACHTTPRSAEGSAEIVGQTFLPDEAACAKCHGERYRGLIDGWRTGLVAMHEAVATKAVAARAAVGAGDVDKAARARKLMQDAEHNVRFVALANGSHNPFYAARLLTRAGEWFDEATTSLGKPPARTGDRVLRNYCAALCHEPLGMKLKETVSFGAQRLPHARHATELGAACTTCHSADVHKKTIATAATCSSCHHAPQNDRCETCHRDQAAFYRGTVKTSLAPVSPNVMAEAVGCTNCHDFSKPRPRAAIAEACTGCHEPTYLPLLTEWTTLYPREAKVAADAVRAAESAVSAARRSGRGVAEATTHLTEARDALALIRRGGAAHNPLAAGALLERAREAAAQARQSAGGR